MGAGWDSTAAAAVVDMPDPVPAAASAPLSPLLSRTAEAGSVSIIIGCSFRAQIDEDKMRSDAEDASNGRRMEDEATAKRLGKSKQI